MDRSLTLLLACLLFASCANNQRQSANEKNIPGDWAIAGFENKDYQGTSYPLAPTYNGGLTFYANNSFTNRGGYFNYRGWGDESTYLGSLSNYQVTGDSLRLFNPENKTWENYKIFKLTHDTLKFGVPGSINIYKRIKSKTSKTPSFDQVILSTSGCFGTCPITNTMISSDGSVVYDGVSYTNKNGLFSGKISPALYRQLEDSFREADFNSLESYYRHGGTDQETVTTTFVKDGKIYKSVEDYGRGAPYFFRWAYLPLRYLHQSVQLEQINYPEFAQDSINIISSKLRKGNMILDLKKSESFLLFYYLRNGKIANVPFKARFNFHVYYNRKADIFYDLYTDGRYYKFIVKGKPVTINIGFNFYDVNVKNWVWRKANEYD